MYFLCRNNMPNCGDPLLPLRGISLCKAQELLNYTLDSHRDCREPCRQNQVLTTLSTEKGWFTGMQGHRAALCSRVLTTLCCCWFTGRGRNLICCVWRQPLNASCNQAGLCETLLSCVFVSSGSEIPQRLNKLKTLFIGRNT